jgi:hypothetical protein
MGKSRTPKAMVGIDGHVGHPVLGQTDQLRVAVRRKIDALQVAINNLGKDPLVVADDDQLAG